MTSEELRKAGYKGNNLLRDQRAAFCWISKFISGFGGDPDSITVIGESSGASKLSSISDALPNLLTVTVGVTLHLCSPQPLFHRAIATGGTFLLRKPLPPAAHEGIYQQAISALGLDKLDSEQRINSLLTMPLDEIIATLPPSLAFNAIVDSELIGSEVSYASVASYDAETMPGKKWCQALMVGDCQFDVSY
jgi:carboxylesterase type B